MSFICLFKLLIFQAQAPNVTYTSPNTFSVNETIIPLQPTNTGGIIPSEPVVSTFAGTGSVGSLDGTSGIATFNFPTVVTLGNQNNIIVVDRSNHKIRNISSTKNVSTIAGTGTIGAVNGPSNMASFRFPDGAIVDSQGNIFITDQSNHKIRKIDINGQVSTFAGTGIAGFQDGAALSAKFYFPAAMAIDSNDNLYIADYSNHRIRKITPDGLVSTVAGLGSAGAIDGNTSTATFNGPTGLCLDSSGIIYVADYGNHKIRKIDTNGQVSTFVGSGIAGAVDNNGIIASFNHPAVVTMDSQNNFYVTDEDNNKIRKINALGDVTTFAGTGSQGAIDDVASLATFKGPTGIVVNDNDEVIIADYGNHKIRKITTYKYTISPSLPNGLSLNQFTGEIAGTPSVISPMTDYTVSVSNQFGTSSFIISIEVGSLATKTFGNNQIQLFPNPVKDILNVYSIESIKTVTVFNTLGQEIKKLIPNQENFQIDFSTIEKGIYFLKMESNLQTNRMKITKN
ncbi:T9SS type A sorting domain-containing protein [Flavobacterium jejuense]|nr:T9SS type A sorting domain-containing protein [Flavobacterium jejuense]